MAHVVMRGAYSRSLVGKITLISLCVLFGFSNFRGGEGNYVGAYSSAPSSLAYDMVADTGYLMNVAHVDSTPTPEPEIRKPEVAAAVKDESVKTKTAAKTAAPTKNTRVASTKPIGRADPDKGKILSNDKKTAGSCNMVWPVLGSRHVTQRFARGHTGYDISYDDSGDMYLPIVASDDGVVTTASYGWNGGYGNMIIIDHGNGYSTRYGHLKSISVEVGEQVSAGQKIGVMGATGNVHGRTGIHLHFEVMKNGAKISPANCI